MVAGPADLHGAYDSRHTGRSSQVVQATKLRSGLAGSHMRVVAAAAACLTLAVCLPWVVVDAAALGELAQNPDPALLVRELLRNCGDAGFIIGTHCVCQHPRTCTGGLRWDLRISHVGRSTVSL